MENNIEEDIKVLENLLDEGFEAMCYEEAQAINHILSDYKRVLERNEVLLKENEDFKREIERQKDINTIINTKGIDKCYEKVLEKTMTKFLNNNIANDFIPKKKVKDKIEELKKDENSKYYYMFLEDRDLENTIQVLQELLESEEK